MTDNTMIITCPQCRNFKVTDPGTAAQDVACLAGCVDFMKQLSSGQTTVCEKAERKA